MNEIQSKNDVLLVFASDGTGIASETLGLTLMTQFEGYSEAQHETLPFIKNEMDCKINADLINNSIKNFKEIIVFSTLAEKNIRESFKSLLEVKVFDFFDLMLPTLSQNIEKNICENIGVRHKEKKDLRSVAIDYALQFDDGQKFIFN